MHLRSEDEYIFFLGWYCDECYDWIEADDAHWRFFAKLRIADPSGSHPITNIFASDDVGHAVADFLR